VKKSIDLINEIGFEAFTFKKLAIEVNTTEASVYRYFENKHRLLLYIISWYWHYIDYLIDYNLKNVVDDKQKLILIIQLLSRELPESTGGLDYNKKILHQIVVAESSKVYLIKDVSEINITPAQVAELANLVESGRINDRIARTVLAKVLEGAGSPEDIVKSEGLEVVSDDGALIAAIDEALAKQPDVLEKIREGKVQAAGAVIGAVMQAMKGQADAARVRELVLERANRA
jgi:Asp-tRNA(Asn)/Glu-tRNA(Gln) amidotransferase B subunit